MTAVTGGKPLLGRTSTGLYRMHASTTRPSQAMLKTSVLAHTFCLQDNHDHNTCPRNPHRPLLGWLPQMGAWPMPVFTQQAPAQPSMASTSREICRRFNEGRCNRQQRCKYLHNCLTCNGPHPQIQCPNRPPSGRSRSPQHRGPPPLPGQAPTRHQYYYHNSPAVIT